MNQKKSLEKKKFLLYSRHRQQIKPSGEEKRQESNA